MDVAPRLGSDSVAPSERIRRDSRTTGGREAFDRMLQMQGIAFAREVAEHVEEFQSSHEEDIEHGDEQSIV